MVLFDLNVVCSVRNPILDELSAAGSRDGGAYEGVQQFSEEAAEDALLSNSVASERSLLSNHVVSSRREHGNDSSEGMLG